MTKYDATISLAKEIQKKYPLCDQCLGRFFAKKLHLKSYRLLGKKLHTRDGRCYICRDLFDNLQSYLNMMVESCTKISFSTFTVGTIIKPSFADRDDHIRSRYNLQVDSLKTDITTTLAKLYARRTKKLIDLLDPDITITIDLKTSSCNVRSKHILLAGEYLKLERNIPQQQSPCPNCAKKGCRTCNYHGIGEINSIEGFISKIIFAELGGTTAKFTWVGGEDKISLVLARRPFYVKLNNPSKRHLESVDLSSDAVYLYNLRTISDIPKQPIKFRSTCTIFVYCPKWVDSAILKKLHALAKQPIIVYARSGKRTTKTIYSLRYRRKSDRTFLVMLTADGGLPIKRFVTGDDVSPSIHSVLGISCDVLYYDITDIKIVSDEP